MPRWRGDFGVAHATGFAVPRGDDQRRLGADGATFTLFFSGVPEFCSTLAS